MNLAAVRVLLRKELLDLLRDRRTLISLVVAPMLVGPVIMSVMNYYVRRSEQQARVNRFRIGVAENQQIPGLRDALDSAGLDVVSVPVPRASVEKKDVTFGIEVTGSPEHPQLTFYSDNSDITATMARSRVNEAIDAVWRDRIRSELARRNVPASVIQPFGRKSVNVAQPRKMTAAFVGRMIAFLLLIFLFNGAMYAAVDTTAGEKERRTLEILLASAASRTEIVTSKVATAVVTSFGTTALSMASYAVAYVRTGRRTSGSALTLPTDAGTLALIALLILPVGVFAGAICVAVATPAKSTREAMSYLTPGLFVVMGLGLTTFVLAEPVSPALMAVPFANFAQMLREVLSGEWSWMHYAVAVSTNLLYSAVAVVIAARRFSKENILFRT